MENSELGGLQGHRQISNRAESNRCHCVLELLHPHKVTGYHPAVNICVCVSVCYLCGHFLTHMTFLVDYVHLIWRLQVFKYVLLHLSFKCNLWCILVWISSSDDPEVVAAENVPFKYFNTDCLSHPLIYLFFHYECSEPVFLIFE